MRRDFFMGFLGSFFRRIRACRVSKSGVIVVVVVASYYLGTPTYFKSLARIAHLQWYFVGLARYQYYV